MTADALGNFVGKRLVVFGAGYVGTELVRHALKQCMQVVALTRNAAKAQVLVNLGAETVVADLASSAWHDQIARADYVVNCVSSGGGGAEAYHHSYVEGTRSIVRWLERAGGTERFLYTGSTSVYPQSGGMVDETASTENAMGNARVLLNAEAEVACAASGGAARGAVTLRLAGIYGPDRHHVLDQLRAQVRPLPGRGDHRLNLIYRDDIVSALFFALTLSGAPYQVFNVVDDMPVTKKDLVAWLAERLGLAVPEFSGEALPGRRPDPPDRAVSNHRLRARGWEPRFPDFRRGYEAILGA